MKAKLQACGAGIADFATGPDLGLWRPQRASGAARARRAGVEARRGESPRARSELVLAVKEAQQGQRTESQILIGLSLFAAVAVFSGLADTLRLVEQWDGFIRVVRQILG